MYADIVFPKNDEKDFIEIAEKLCYSSLVFIYGLKEDFESNKPKIIKLQETTKIKLYSGLMANIKSINKQENKNFLEFKSSNKFELYKQSKNASGLAITPGSDKSRDVMEKTKTDMIFDLEATAKRDFMHHRASGLNQVLCSIANQKGILIGFSFNSILKADDAFRSQIMGRVSQNIRLCRKYKVKTVIASFAQKPFEMRLPLDLISLFVLLGMHPSEAKKSLQNILAKF